MRTRVTGAKKSTRRLRLLPFAVGFSVTVARPPEVQTDLDLDEWVYDFVRFLALIMNLTLDFSVDAHTERKLNDKFELKNSKTQNNV
jgi:hypothetical protein